MEYDVGGSDCERLQAGNHCMSQLELQQLWPRRIQRKQVVSDGAIISHGAKLLPPMDDVTDSRESVPSLFLAIYSGDSDLLESNLDNISVTASTAKYGGLSPLHAACHAKNLYALTRLISHGAKLEVLDRLGHTALHVAVDEAWHEGVTELLRHGSSPDTLSEPPATVRKVRGETPFHIAVRRGDLLSTTLLMQRKPDLSLRDSDKCSVLHLASHARSIEITRLILQEKICQELVNSTDKKGNSVLHKAMLKPCDSAEEAAVKAVVSELVNAGADVNAINPLGDSPLHLAAKHRLSQVVELLLDQGADSTQLTATGQSVLHVACQQGSATCLTLFLRSDQVKQMVTSPDSEGREPFDYAVHSGSIECCELMLTNGDHLTRVDKDGMSRCTVILKHLPSATELLKRLFDAHVRLSNLSHHDAEYRITFDYAVLYNNEEGVQSSLISELSNSRLEALLKHPLLESFLFLKWHRIKPFFYCSVSLYILFLLLHTTFIIMTFGENSWRWSEHTHELTIILILHITMFLLILIPDLIIMVANFKKYLSQWETFSKAIALCSSAFVIFSYVMTLRITIHNNRLSDTIVNSTAENLTDAGSVYVDMPTIRSAAAISIFFSWVEFMMLLGRFPSLGSYVLMFTRVARSIIKFLVAFSSLIIGFALSFMILFHHKQYFNSFPQSIVKTLMMMIGEIDYGDLQNGLELPVLGCLFLVLFLFLVCVLVANLLIGLAVNDIPDLQRQGKIKRLSKQASYLVAYERLMKVARSLRCFPRQLRILMTSRCRVPQTVDILPNKDINSLNSKTDHYHLPSETLHDAILLGTEDSKGDFPVVEEDDLVAQFRSFKIKYARDRRQLNRRLAQLPDITTTETIITKRLDKMEQMLHHQLLQLSLRLHSCTCTPTLAHNATPLPRPTQYHIHSMSLDDSRNQQAATQLPSQTRHSVHFPPLNGDTIHQQQPQHTNTYLLQQNYPSIHPSNRDALVQRTNTDILSAATQQDTQGSTVLSLQPQGPQVQQEAAVPQPPGAQHPNLQQSIQQEHRLQPLPTQKQTLPSSTQQYLQLEQRLKEVMTQQPQQMPHSQHNKPTQHHPTDLPTNHSSSQSNA